jgi:hypothetical protein
LKPTYIAISWFPHKKMLFKFNLCSHTFFHSLSVLYRYDADSPPDSPPPPGANGAPRSRKSARIIAKAGLTVCS